MKGNIEPIEQTHPWRRMDWYCLAFLLCLVALTWCAAYNRWTSESWATPISYGGDAWGTLAGAKAFSTGEIPPILPKYPASLGAPFRANWNDYPTVEEGMWVWTALLARAFGLFTGANLSLLSASLFAAASFYFVGRRMQCGPAFAFTGAALFALSRFIFARSLPHLPLTYYWHVPLGLLVIWYCLTNGLIHKDRRMVLFCVAVAILHGVQNAYYTAMFFQFLVGAALFHLIRRQPWPRIFFPLILGGVLLFTLGVMNLDTLYYRAVHGPNPIAVTRTYAALELYALKPIELFLPITHRFGPLERWVMIKYARQAYVVGEMGSPYLGLAGIAGLLLLVWETARRLARQQLDQVPFQIWPVLWILAYSVVGGINGLLGLFGVILFRCSNRYGIFILALVLLFLMQRLTAWTRRWHWLPALLLAASIVTLGAWDQIPGSPATAQIAATRQMVQADAAMVATLERRLPKDAMIFQMPVMDFPEVSPVRGVADYEHIRPYLYSKQLRFSYGSNKGRKRERWQKEAEQLGTSRLVGLLESYGFSAVLINRKGYEDGATAMLQELKSLGKTEVLFESPEFFCVVLTPAARPILPP
jgi:hypothetical protein